MIINKIKITVLIIKIITKTIKNQLITKINKSYNKKNKKTILDKS